MSGGAFCRILDVKKSMVTTMASTTIIRRRNLLVEGMTGVYGYEASRKLKCSARQARAFAVGQAKALAVRPRNPVFALCSRRDR